jgi:hypothetical protein
MLAFAAFALTALWWRPFTARAQGNIVTVDIGTTYQTIQGWEGVHQAGQGSPYWNNVGGALLDATVNDVGLTRVRLEVKSGAENTSGTGSGETMVNDNNDPFSINPAGFRWGNLDDGIAKVVNPLRARLSAVGKKLYVNLCYVSFNPGTGYVHASNAEEYAEFIEATFLHISSAFGWVPDGVEVILEPDNTSNWDGTRIGNAIKAAGDRLAAHGWFPEFIAPSVANVDNGVPYLRDVLAVSGVRTYLKEASYHRYGGVASIPAYASYALSQGLRTSMLEHGPGDVSELMYDLTVANVSAWAQEGISFNFPSQSAINSQDSGFAANYLFILDVAPGSIQMGRRTAGFRQVFRYVDAGAVRVGASSNFGAVTPVVFRNPNGGIVVVQQATTAATWSVVGLPAGSYQITYSGEPAGPCPNSCPQVTLNSQTITSGGSVSVSVPGAGVLTLFQAGSTAPRTPPAAPSNLRIVVN